MTTSRGEAGAATGITIGVAALVLCVPAWAADEGAAPPPKLDLPKMLAFKEQGVKGNVDGVAFLLKKNKIDTVHGTATIAAPGKVEVALAAGGAQTLETRSIVIATGSDVARLPGIDIDEETIVSSTGALSLPQVPRRMLVVGAGVIGLELGSVWRRLGTEVQVVEDAVLREVDARLTERDLDEAGDPHHRTADRGDVGGCGFRLRSGSRRARGCHAAERSRRPPS